MFLVFVSGFGEVGEARGLGRLWMLGELETAGKLGRNGFVGL